MCSLLPLFCICYESAYHDYSNSSYGQSDAMRIKKLQPMYANHCAISNLPIVRPRSCNVPFKDS